MLEIGSASLPTRPWGRRNRPRARRLTWTPHAPASLRCENEPARPRWSWFVGSWADKRWVWGGGGEGQDCVWAGVITHRILVCKRVAFFVSWLTSGILRGCRSVAWVVRMVRRSECRMSVRAACLGLPTASWRGPVGSQRVSPAGPCFGQAEAMICKRCQRDEHRLAPNLLVLG